MSRSPMSHEAAIAFVQEVVAFPLRAHFNSAACNTFPATQKQGPALGLSSKCLVLKLCPKCRQYRTPHPAFAPHGPFEVVKHHETGVGSKLPCYGQKTVYYYSAMHSTCFLEALQRMTSAISACPRLPTSSSKLKTATTLLAKRLAGCGGLQS
eukprot:5599494-Pleurochrysis_carterae.AAC.2